MATVVKMTEKVRREATSLFSSHTGNVYMNVLEAQEDKVKIWWIYAAAPTQGNFTTTDTNVKAIFLVDTTGANAAKVSYDQGTTWAALHS
ncbi:MAG: hypothetical protein KDI38_03600 [Calditrichaeota bacterium]|nr:hypothetical protein [Calditrichota bacterium]